MNKQSGFTLIELMIAGFISIFVLAGLMNLFITTNKSVTLSDALSQNQETGRFAMGYLTQFIRKAGYNESITTPFVPPIYMAPGTKADPISCGPPKTGGGEKSSTQPHPCAENNPASAKGDRLSITINVEGNTGDHISSCTGTNIGGNGDWTHKGAKRIVVVFWVSSEQELRCQTFNRDTNEWIDDDIAIINNVERLEFQVGIAELSDSKSASRYVSPKIISDSSIPPENIRSIRIAILTTSQNSIDNKPQVKLRKRNYVLLDEPTIQKDDTSLRNIFTNTIELPNLIETAGT